MLTPPWAVITDGAIDNTYAESSSRVTSKQTVEVVRYLRRASCAQNFLDSNAESEYNLADFCIQFVISREPQDTFHKIVS